MTYPTQPGAPTRPVSPRLAFWTSPAGVVSLLAIAGAVILAIALITDAFSPSPADRFKVQVTSCSATSGPLATATVGFTIENTGDSTASATVSIEYRDADGSRLDTDTSTVRNLPAGETARQDESTILNAVPTGALTCRITGIR